MVELFPIIKGFIKEQNVCISGIRTVVCSGSGDNGDIFYWFGGLIIGINVGNMI